MKSNPTKTLLTISMGFLVIYILGKYNWALWLSVCLGLIGIFSDFLSLWIEKAWMKLALLLSYVVPNVLMGLIFFGILLPIALLSKVFRKQDTLRLKNTSSTVYADSPRAYEKEHFENMW